MIFAAWLALVVLTTFYCYFCEQRLFPKQKLLDWNNRSNKSRRGFGMLFCRHRDRAASYADW